MEVHAWAQTDVGRVRSTNEDCVYIDPDGELILVLDGMGGHNAGEIASALAMKTIHTFYKEHARKSEENSDIFESYDHSFTYHSNLLRQAVLNANRVVLAESQQSEERTGMGSTVAGMAIDEYTLSTINVGDSRVYLIRGGELELISRDHTLAEDQVERGILTPEEARESQLRHILSSVIGVDGKIRVHMDELAVFPGDTFLLCTDGLTAVMEDYEIEALLMEHEPGPELVERLIEEVNARGGPDNVTVAVTVFAEGKRRPKESKLSSFFSRTLGGAD